MCRTRLTAIAAESIAWAYALISNACHSLCRVTRGFNILCQIMVTFLSYISNACHSLSGVAERLQHTCKILQIWRKNYVMQGI